MARAPILYSSRNNKTYTTVYSSNIFGNARIFIQTVRLPRLKTPLDYIFMFSTLLGAGRGRGDVGVDNPLVNTHVGTEFESQQRVFFNLKSNTTTVEVGWDRQKAKRNKKRKGNTILYIYPFYISSTTFGLSREDQRSASAQTQEIAAFVPPPS